ncbi:XRE family transcriptional regulator [Asticcacaulis sp. DW145]|jgi:predicted XRE-type DNA-binding protein|uniref:helix-turn-helix domain-containing protein n=1 Tax=Asticcacaulis sp. DW145 TaxID=3095608 RepID=UPI00308DDF3C|nr:XRE family transcriptional regulator [Asticcacaulis sp. DW145]
MTSQRFDTVWEALADTPVEAKVMRMRSELMTDIAAFIKARGLTQVQASEFLGITQPRVSDLLRGKLGKFNLETLIALSERTGQRIDLQKSRAA